MFHNFKFSQANFGNLAKSRDKFRFFKLIIDKRKKIFIQINQNENDRLILFFVAARVSRDFELINIYHQFA